MKQIDKDYISWQLQMARTALDEAETAFTAIENYASDNDIEGFKAYCTNEMTSEFDDNTYGKVADILCYIDDIVREL